MSYPPFFVVGEGPGGSGAPPIIACRAGPFCQRNDSLPAAWQNRCMNEEESRIRRPHHNLLKYYLLVSLLFGPFFPLAMAYFFFRFKTLEYVFDDEGLTMRWGVLFRREISLTYARIQDIHLVSHIVERWLDLGRVQIQTAAGSSVAEITIEGLMDFEDVRDLLYARMRGMKEGVVPVGAEEASLEGGNPEESPGDLASALREASTELRALRAALVLHRTQEQQAQEEGS